MKNRRQQYKEFLQALANLFDFAVANDIIFKGNEWWRSFDQAAEYSKKGIGSKNSKHCYSLAVDIYIVNETGKKVLMGKIPSEYAKYKMLGDYWHSIGMVWGDTIRKGDVYHFEHPEKPA